MKTRGQATAPGMRERVYMQWFERMVANNRKPLPLVYFYRGRMFVTARSLDRTYEALQMRILMRLSNLQPISK